MVDGLITLGLGSTGAYSEIKYSNAISESNKATHLIDPINKDAINFIDNGVGTHLRRTTTVQGKTIQINSGHAYNRTHIGGDVRKSNLSMDAIDSAIVKDISKNIDTSSIPKIPQSQNVKININGYELTYRVTKLPNGNIIVSSYFPGE